MSELLRALAELVTAAANRLGGSGPLIYVEHLSLGDVHNGAIDDEDCDCVDHDADTPQPTYVLLPVPDAADLFAEAGRRCRNGDNPEDVGWELARNLEMGRDVA